MSVWYAMLPGCVSPLTFLLAVWRTMVTLYLACAASSIVEPGCAVTLSDNPVEVTTMEESVASYRLEQVGGCAPTAVPGLEIATENTASEIRKMRPMPKLIDRFLSRKPILNCQG